MLRLLAVRTAKIKSEFVVIMTPTLSLLSVSLIKKVFIVKSQPFLINSEMNRSLFIFFHLKLTLLSMSRYMIYCVKNTFLEDLGHNEEVKINTDSVTTDSVPHQM